MNTIKPSIPDFANMTLIDNTPRVSEEQLKRGRRKPRKRPHPAAHLPVPLQHEVDRVLDGLRSEYADDGDLSGYTRSEARQILTAALYILDTDMAPEFADEND